ncbi:PREDICTED: signal peptide peptidase-like 2 [Nelumbo nucifera]|uniref:Signal peptide peptidase-like 2 n=1 Tax=Nelumbo nucifera TaxID=4432 RepID=A0A1U7Z6N2_NELNU|nr:PREDICTED: signal peptide peptidase-like 2 [Nelumbo nucifera]
MHTCIVTLIVRIFRNCGQKMVNLPIFGEVSILSVGVVPFCVAFAIFWAANQNTSYAWIGQDVLGICLMISVLQLVRLPNIKVASVLLCCAFVYDIFWVFLSPLIFHESVMIANMESSKDVQMVSSVFSGSADIASGMITTVKLDGTNFLEWSQFAKLTITGRGKLGFITGKEVKPNLEDPKFTNGNRITPLLCHG